ncbi:MAG: ABC transporter ATP-binding protein [Telmatospirillum sp.]|nr:ABC transporter ATP-binding protein [Telmatospirillum sp.]
MISIDQVAKRFAGPSGETIDALAPVSLTVARGEFLSIVGPSGCGKSTLLRLIAGLDAPSSGRIALAEEFRESARRRIGFVFQDPVLLPWLSTLANIRFPLDTAGTDRAEADARAHHLLDLVGLAGFADALPHQLSGGMRQRASIARALSYDPPILLMDEPFGALDLLTRDRLNDELLRIWEETRKTVVFVTHSVEEAAYLSDRVAVMSPRPGIVKAIHTVDLARPRGEATKLDPRFHALMAQFRKDLR